jgi:hypothetical protein
MIVVRRALDRAADRTAHGLLAWSADRVDPSRRGWIDETRWQLAEIDGGLARLMWAVGGLRRVWLPGQPAGRPRHEWPESWIVVAGGMLLGFLALIVFATHVADLERMPPELVFGFVGLYFYAAGFLSGRRTGKVGTGAWAGAASGLAFGAVVYVLVFTTAAHAGLRESIRSGPADLVAIAWSGLVFFVLLGAGCGALGARAATQTGRATKQAGRDWG